MDKSINYLNNRKMLQVAIWRMKYAYLVLKKKFFVIVMSNRCSILINFKIVLVKKIINKIMTQNLVNLNTTPHIGHKYHKIYVLFVHKNIITVTALVLLVVNQAVKIHV